MKYIPVKVKQRRFQALELNNFIFLFKESPVSIKTALQFIAFQYIPHYKTLLVSIDVTKEVLEKTVTVERNQT